MKGKVGKKKVIGSERKKQGIDKAVAIISETDLFQRGKCKICENPALRLFVMESYTNGMSVWKLRSEIKDKFNIGLATGSIEEHINEHEKQIAPWLGLVKYKFGSEEERKKFEAAFLAKVSLVCELWDKYQVLAELFKLVAGEKDNINPSAVNRPKAVTELAGQMKDYLVELLKLQKERDVVVEVAKVVLYMLADKLVSRLGAVISDLPVERKEIIGSILKEEVKNALEYAKEFGREKVEDMLKVVQSEYEKLVSGKR
jgi:hypothetical protein